MNTYKFTGRKNKKTFVSCILCNRMVTVSKKVVGDFICSYCVLRKELLKDYEMKRIKICAHYDCHFDSGGDEYTRPDKDRDCVYFNFEYDFDTLADVRVQFSPKIGILDAIRGLDKIKKTLISHANIGFIKVLDGSLPKVKISENLLHEEVRPGEEVLICEIEKPPKHKGIISSLKKGAI